MSVRMSLLERLFYTTVRISGFDTAGNEVEGTAFFLRAKNNGIEDVFLVSNRHLVKDIRRCVLKLHAYRYGRPDRTRTVDLDIKGIDRLWIHHEGGTDISILPISSIMGYIDHSDAKAYFQALDGAMVPDERSTREQIDAVEDVYFIGYPNGLYDDVHNLPIIRKGTTSTPFWVDFKGERQFLIDGNIFPGSSGSPVLLIDRSDRFDRKDRLDPKKRVLFLGMIMSAFQYSEEDCTPKQMMDLGVVIKSRVILDLAQSHLKEGVPDAFPVLSISKRIRKMLESTEDMRPVKRYKGAT